MKSFLFLALICKISAIPIKNDQIYFPDEIDDSVQDLRTFNPLKLLSDSNILKSDNNSFIKDEAALQDLESGKFYQGDILLVQDQEDFLKLKLDDNDKFPSRTGVISESYRWPRSSLKPDTVVVPFVISDDYCE